MDERRPLLKALSDYASSKPIRMHMPGHKGRDTFPHVSGLDPQLRWAWEVLDQARVLDVTECPGLDNLHYPKGCIRQVEERAKETFGSLCSYLLINGASCGIQASFMAVRMCLGEGKVILPRNTHKSAISAAVLSGLEPVWVWPEYEERYGGYLPLDSRRVTQAIKSISKDSKADEVRAVFAINPTYCGFARELTGLAEAAHSEGAMLIVDEAHGTHFGFHRMLPKSALKCGGDVVVHGAHKTGLSFTQTGLLHVGEGAEERFPGIVSSIEECLRTVQSTSPSYLLMASLEQAIDVLKENDAQWVKNGVDTALEITHRLQMIPGISVGEVDVSESSAHDLRHDPCRIFVDLRELGVSGPKAAEFLISKKAIYPEMVGPSYVVLIWTGADGQEEMDALVSGFEDLSSEFRMGANSPLHKYCSLGESPRPNVCMGLREAFFSPAESIPLESSDGRISADTLITYPPGAPIIVPGEMFDSKIINYLLEANNMGLDVLGRGIRGGDYMLSVYCVK